MNFGSQIDIGRMHMSGCLIPTEVSKRVLQTNATTIEDDDDEDSDSTELAKVLPDVAYGLSAATCFHQRSRENDWNR